MTGVIHFIDAPGSFGDATHKGLLFLANGIGAIVAGLGIYRGERTWGWGLGVLVAGGALVGYVISRTVGLPGLAPDIWLEPLGVLSLMVEAAFIVLFAQFAPGGAAQGIVGAHMRVFVLLALAPVAESQPVSAQTDEIQVYDGGLTAKGRFNFTLHNNFTPRGLTTPAFPGALVADKSLNGVLEWAYGVTGWFDAGLYMPLYSIGKRDAHTGAMLDGFKMRLLFAVPHADDRTFFYGVNFELSYNAKYWDATRLTSEVRPIIGWHLHPVDIIVNPIFDTSYDGLKNVNVAPATRLACNLSPTWGLALEEYDQFGPLRQFYASHQQVHQLYGVLDHAAKALHIEAGVGFGLTSASDAITLKLILSHDLN